MNGLTITQLTQAVGNVTPRMVRHYHQLGLMPQPNRSDSNYRLYSQQDVQRLKRIVALKQQGFQLSHIRKLLEADAEIEPTQQLMDQLQQQYRTVIQQMTHLRQTAAALEGLLGRDRSCQTVQAEAIAQLKQLEVETQAGLEELWNGLDAQVHQHPEQFQESLQRLLPLSRSDIETDLLANLVLACGDVSLVSFVRLSREPERHAIAAARSALKAGCSIIVDSAIVASALDQTRLAHLGCTVTALINNPHIHSADEAEQAFWHDVTLKQQLRQLANGAIVIIGYAPSVLLATCEAITHQIQPALVIGMPIGFSHAPAAKRQLMRLPVPYITIEGTMGGGLLAAVALNALVQSLMEKPDCHCYLS
ncbi:precorrin-8X methylmutase [Thermocoleostomius sinensis]|uniref:Precorrin-8X methylmutase n=1 Tax=Thermocoleostomius sinensis A174 TaxID=2016057 RepID=A0A9E8ZNZ5_9CYAN|nr:precorrin-8X methylmutase [Thermocoleostomius sinensis]WAL62096.1 precorrin-8X methylmutase [Thermocoleostomius sinensis A174]